MISACVDAGVKAVLSKLYFYLELHIELPDFQE